MNKIAYSLIGLAFTASPLWAQSQAGNAAAEPATSASPATPATPADSATDSAAVPATPAKAATPAQSAASTYTDVEVEKFAAATLKLQAVQNDAALDQAGKQAKMVAIVKAVGIEPGRYNSMSKAVQTDEALRTRVQAAVAKQAPAPAQG
jgi:hypothetical protein